MKNSLKPLPTLKQEELEKIVSTIRNHCGDVEKIILFGSYAKGTYKERKDLAQDRRSGHVSDYDILVVTAKAINALDTNLWHKIGEECRNLALSADPRILTNDIEELNNKLSVGQYFYSDIKEEGILIFDAKNFDLVDRRTLSPEETKKFREEYFDHWFGVANEFFIDYQNALSRNSYKKAAFELHQAAEHAYKTILLVFTLYNPNEHFLDALGVECKKHCPELKNLFKDLFHKNTQEEKERFKLLDYAYIGGRYDPRYQISREDLEILASDVKKLLEITKMVCERKSNNHNQSNI